MDIGKRFKFFREKCGMSQKEAADLIGIKYYQLGNYETNRSEPSISILKQMSKIYGVSIDQLVGNNRFKKQMTDQEKDEMDKLFEMLDKLVEEYKKI